MAKLTKQEWKLLHIHNIINITVSMNDLKEKEIKSVFNKVLSSQRAKKKGDFF